MGLRQNLTPGQIVDQVVQVRRMFTRELGPISNVVFMVRPGCPTPLSQVQYRVQWRKGQMPRSGCVRKQT